MSAHYKASATAMSVLTLVVGCEGSQPTRIPVPPIGTTARLINTPPGGASTSAIHSM